MGYSLIVIVAKEEGKRHYLSKHLQQDLGDDWIVFYCLFEIAHLSFLQHVHELLEEKPVLAVTQSLILQLPYSEFSVPYQELSQQLPVVLPFCLDLKSQFHHIEVKGLDYGVFA